MDSRVEPTDADLKLVPPAPVYISPSKHATRSSPPPVAPGAAPSKLAVSRGKWRRRLPSLIPIALLLGFNIVLVILYIVFHDSILTALSAFAVQLKTLGIGAYFILGAIVFLTAFPPLPGHGLIVTLCGWVFGWLGAIPALAGAYLGACACFLLFRHVGYRYTQRLISSNPKTAAMVRAVEARGFGLLCLILLAPYPFNLLNALFGTSNISFGAFALATALTLPKILLDIAIGTQLTKLTDSLLDHPSLMTWAVAIALGTVFVGVTAYLVWVCRRAVKRLEEDERWRQEVESKMALMAESDEDVDADLAAPNV